MRERERAGERDGNRELQVFGSDSLTKSHLFWKKRKKGKRGRERRERQMKHRQREEDLCVPFPCSLLFSYCETRLTHRTPGN